MSSRCVPFFCTKNGTKPVHKPRFLYDCTNEIGFYHLFPLFLQLLNHDLIFAIVAETYMCNINCIDNSRTTNFRCTITSGTCTTKFKNMVHLQPIDFTGLTSICTRCTIFIYNIININKYSIIYRCNLETLSTI